MNKIIYKYQIDRDLLELPIGYKILSIQLQNNKMTLWAEIDPLEENLVEVNLIFIGTGVNFDNSDKEYVTTIQEGNLVWHCYKIIK